MIARLVTVIACYAAPTANSSAGVAKPFSECTPTDSNLRPLAEANVRVRPDV